MDSIEIFQSSDNQASVSVTFKDDTVWLNRTELAELFGRDIKTIGKHLTNVFSEGELIKEVVVAKFATTTQHGAIQGKTQTKDVEYYNLDVIISVGYRVKSQRGTQFRIWATSKLKELLIQGYTLNEKRLEQKQLEVEHLKNGIRILQRAVDLEIEDRDNEMLSLFSKGLSLLDDYDHEQLDSEGSTTHTTV